MKLKAIVIALAALSVSTVAVANTHQAKHAYNRHAIIRYLEGNSYEADVTHTYLNHNNSGFWVGGFGQMSGAYNTDYLLVHHTYMPHYGQQQGSTLTFSVDHMDALFGFDSTHVGFFTDLGYQYFADYNKETGKGNEIGLYGNHIDVHEAFLTYQFCHAFGIKAGKFLPDYGYVNVYQPLQTLASALYSQHAVTGAEVVTAMHNFHASAAGVVEQSADNNKNSSHPNVLILNAGYDLHSKYGTAELQASYASKSTLNPVTFSANDKEVALAWLVGAHFVTSKYAIRADVQTINYKSLTYKPWIYDGSFTYILNNKTSVGAYGDFIYNTPADASIHWLAGLTGAYKINHHLTANVYAQRVQVTTDAKNKGAANNITVMGALSISI